MQPLNSIKLHQTTETEIIFLSVDQAYYILYIIYYILVVFAWYKSILIHGNILEKKAFYFAEEFGSDSFQA